MRVRSSSSGVIARTTLPGMPITTERGGMRRPSVTNVPAATRHSSPISQPDSSVAPMPIRQSRPIRVPCRMAPCPTTTPSPTSMGASESVWTMQPSWRLTRGPRLMDARSPRTTQPNQMLTPGLSETLPATTAVLAM